MPSRSDPTSSHLWAEDGAQQAGKCVVELLTTDPVHGATTFGFSRDDAGFSEDPEVVAQGAFRDGCVEGSAGDGLLSRIQLADELKPDGISQGMEHRGRLKRCWGLGDRSN